MTPNSDKILFQVLYTACLATLIAIAGISLFRYASSPTDENLFTSTPSNLYVTAAIPGRSLDAAEDQQNATGNRNNSIRVGDLLLALDNEVFGNAEEVRDYLNSRADGDSVEVVIFRPVERSEFAFLASRNDIPADAFRVIPSSVYVIAVRKGGASDQAGLKKGDLITRINDQGFKDHQEADQILRYVNKIGTEIDYEVIRDNQHLQLQIKLAKVGIHLAALFLLFTGLVFIGSGALIALRRPQYKAARLIGAAFLAIGFILSVMLRRDIDYDTLALSRDALMLFCSLFCLPIWLHIGHYFPRENRALLQRPWILWVGYGLAAVFTTAVLITGAQPTANIAIALMILYNIAIAIRYRKSLSEESKTINRHIRRTTISAAVVILVLMTALYFFAPVDAAYVADGSVFFITISSVLFFIPVSLLYTIGQYRLLDLDIRVRRNVQYNLATVVWTLLLLAAFLRLLFYLPNLEFEAANIQIKGSSLVITDDPLTPEESRFFHQIVVMLLAVGFSYLFWKLRRIGQRFIDRKFFRSQSDFRKAAGELAEVMSTRFSMLALAEGIVKKLSELLQLKMVGIIFLRNENECCCEKVYGMEEVRWEQFCSTMLDRISPVIYRNHEESFFSSEYMPVDIRSELNADGVRHMIAIRSKNKLLGILLLGEKRSESPFHQEDLLFLGAVAKQASVALENAFLYEELAEQQRMKHELEIARKIQLASLPQSTPQIEGLEIAGISVPAQEVGGDYFDYLNGPPGKITVIIGDVSGKGTSAALYMSKIQGIMRSLHDFGLSPSELLVRVNQLLLNDLEKSSFVTVLGGYFQTGQRQLKIARAGHLPLFHYRKHSGEVEMHTPNGIGLGLAESGKFASELAEDSLTYQAGDVFLFVTDGITEAQDKDGQEFGEQRLLDHLRNTAGSPAKRIRDQLIVEVNQFTNGIAPHDDLTVVVVKAV